MDLVESDRITWVTGDEREGPRQVIGVLEVHANGFCRAAFAERTQVDGRCHVLLARQAWGGKDSLETRWWSLVLDRRTHKVNTVRNGSCGDALRTQDVPRVVAAGGAGPAHRADDGRGGRRPLGVPAHARAQREERRDRVVPFADPAPARPRSRSGQPSLRGG